MMRTQIPNWRENAGLARARDSGGNRPKSNGPAFSCGKTHCNGSVGLPTLTWNRSSTLEPLLTLLATQGFKEATMGITVCLLVCLIDCFLLHRA